MNPPINPHMHQLIHPPIGGGVSTAYKSLNRIKLSQLVEDLLHFSDLTLGLGVAVWLGGGVQVEPPCMCTQMHMHACVHTHIW